VRLFPDCSFREQNILSTIPLVRGLRRRLPGSQRAVTAGIQSWGWRVLPARGRMSPTLAGRQRLHELRPVGPDVSDGDVVNPRFEGHQRVTGAVDQGPVEVGIG